MNCASAVLRVTDHFCGYPWQLSHSIVLQAHFALDFTTTIPTVLPSLSVSPSLLHWPPLILIPSFLSIALHLRVRRFTVGLVRNFVENGQIFKFTVQVFSDRCIERCTFASINELKLSNIYSLV